MVIHYGSNINSGHYTAVGFNNSDNKYYLYNDSSMSQLKSFD